ncbi:hypothetical protein [Enorma massiliensis]|uniref:hypothetical protein n=1 Tax=Enorma massiliensis TaxID=1472761 RepID=UPI003AEF86FD
MDRIPDKDCLISRFALPVAQFQASGTPRQAPVYEVGAKTAEYNGRSFTYFVGTKKVKTISAESLPSELFGTDLQKCDTTDTDALLEFSGKYGFIPSPLYDGAASLIRFRNRGRLRPYAKTETGWYRNQADNAALSLLLNYPASLYESLDWDMKGETPRVLTEHARMVEANNLRVHEVISKAELAQAIRSIQCATAMASLYDYMAQVTTGGSAMQMSRLLNDPAQLNQRGAEYFLHHNGLIVRGHKLVSFEERLADDEEFAKLVSETQCDAEATYNIALADAYRACAQDALNYLSTADRVYRAAIYFPETASAGIGDIFAAKLESLKDMRNGNEELGTFGEIVTAQFARCFVSKTPWRRCQYCGRVFKKYREEGFNKNIRETKFCKKSCNVMYIQHQKREQP